MLLHWQTWALARGACNDNSICAIINLHIDKDVYKRQSFYFPLLPHLKVYRNCSVPSQLRVVSVLKSYSISIYSPAVSYTHLDVYKRQSSNRVKSPRSFSNLFVLFPLQLTNYTVHMTFLCGSRIFLCELAVDSLFHYLAAVSYTHLVVYKRQFHGTVLIILHHLYIQIVQWIFILTRFRHDI